MRLGALLSPIDGSDPSSITRQARDLESAGYSSIWSAQAMGRGFMMADPFVALSAVAAVTESVEIGTAVLQLPLYNPTDVAYKAFTLSQVSGGRFILGVGAGSTESDYRVHREAFTNRFVQFDQRLAQLKATFATGETDDSNLNPWPSVQGGPPVYFGTWGRNVQRAAKDFDGWIASGMHRSPEACATSLAAYRAAGGGRAIVSTLQLPAGTDLGEFRAKLDIFRDAGFDDAVVMFLPGGPSLDEVRQLI